MEKNDLPNSDLLKIIGETCFFGEEDYFYLIKCPACGFEFNHFRAPYVVKGNDNYEAWRGRGSMVVIPFWGECGHEWELCIGFHKGQCFMFTNVIDKDKYSEIER